MTTKLPSIPAFTGDNVADVLSAISEALQVRTGQRGDTLDAGVTFRDLANLSLVTNTETNGSNSTTTTSAGNVKVIPITTGFDLYDGTLDLKTPPAPTDLKVSAVFGTALLSWNQPAVLNLSFTEIYKSFSNDVTTAMLAGTSSSQFFTDNPGSNRTIYYWIRVISQAAVKSPWNSTAGTAVTTTVDPAVIIPVLEGQILESSLSQSLASRISDAYDGLTGTGTKITNETIARTTADSSLTQQITNQASSFANTLTGYTTTASLQTNYYTKTDANTAIATSTNTVTARLDNIGGLTMEQKFAATADLSGLNAQYTVKIDNNGHVSGFGLASAVVNGTPSSAFIIRADKFAIVDPASGANSLTNAPSADAVPFAVDSGVVYIKVAAIKDASITSAKIGSLDVRRIASGYTSATIGMSAAKLHGAELYAGGTTTITYSSETINGVVYQYPIAMSTANPTFKVVGSDVEIVAANFKIKQLNTSATATTVFEIVDGVTQIKSALIGTGTITSAKIADTIQSTNWSDGSVTTAAGWQINKNGNATFNTIAVTSGQITGVLTLGYKINSYSGLLVQIGQAYPVSMTNGPYYAYGNQGVPMYLVFSSTMPPPEGSASHKIAMVVNVQASAGGVSKDLGVAIFVGSTITAPVIATDEDGSQYAATGGTITGGENIANIVATGVYGMLTAGIGATTYAYNVQKSVHIFVHGYNANYTIQSIQGLMWGIR